MPHLPLLGPVRKRTLRQRLLPGGSKHPMPSVKRLFYVAFDEERMVVRRVLRGRQWEEVPELAVDELDRVRGIGRTAAEAVAEAPGLRLRKGFGGSERLVNDLDAAVTLIRYPITLMLRRHWWNGIRRKRPDLILHPLARREVTPIEELGLIALGERAGARSVHVWSGDELTLEPIATFGAALAGLRSELGRMYPPPSGPWG
jgi:hypothetical protein